MATGSGALIVKGGANVTVVVLAVAPVVLGAVVVGSLSAVVKLIGSSIDGATPAALINIPNPASQTNPQ